MNWPSEAILIDYLAKVSLAFALGLVVSRIIRHDLKVRKLVWSICFLLPVWLLLPIPKVLLPLLNASSDRPSQSAHVFELEPGFTAFDSIRRHDPGPTWLILVFAASITLGLMVLTLRWFTTVKLIRAAEQVVDDDLIALLYELGQQHGLDEAPILKLSDKLESPFVWGIVQPVIVVPSNFSELARSDWRSMLIHEVSHLAQRDPMRLLLYSIVQHAFWWNPLIWFGFRNAVLTQEQRIDSQFTGSNDYAKLLMRSAVASTSSARLGLLGQSSLLVRIRAIAEQNVPVSKPWKWVAMLPLAPIVVPVQMVAPYRPDPSRIGFDEMVFQSNQTGVNRLWRMSSDGRNPQPMSDHFILAGVPSISPDGEWIAYTRDVHGQEDIHISRVDGTNELPVVSTPARDVQALWSPDGTKLIYCTMKTGKWEIGFHDFVTGQSRLVTTDGGINLEPSWHPNGKRIAFSSHRAGPQNIWSMNLDGSELVQLTKSGWEDTAARYSRNGRDLLFSTRRFGKSDTVVLDLSSRELQILSPVSLPETGEARFVDNDRAVLMSSMDANSERNILRFDLATRACVPMNLDGAQFWPSTR